MGKAKKPYAKPEVTELTAEQAREKLIRLANRGDPKAVLSRFGSSWRRQSEQSQSGASQVKLGSTCLSVDRAGVRWSAKVGMFRW